MSKTTTSRKPLTEIQRARKAEYSWIWSENHKEERAAYQKAWRAAHPDYYKNYRKGRTIRQSIQLTEPDSLPASLNDVINSMQNKPSCTPPEPVLSIEPDIDPTIAPTPMTREERAAYLQKRLEMFS